MHSYLENSSEMKTAIIIDDEPLARSIIKEYLGKYDIASIIECGDGFEGLKMIQSHDPYLVFLDVQMPKISGLEMLELLDNAPPIIFTTAFEEHAVRAFEANAVDYLLKPISQERFDESMKRLQNRTQSNIGLRTMLDETETHRIVLKDQGEIKILSTMDVHFIEADDDYVKIHCTNKPYLKKATLTSYEKRLPKDQFLRVHRSYLVSLPHVSKIEPYEKSGHRIVLKSGARIPVSRAGYQKLRTILGV